MPLWGEKLIYNTVLFHVIQIHVLPNIMVMGDFFFFSQIHYFYHY